MFRDRGDRGKREEAGKGKLKTETQVTGTGRDMLRYSLDRGRIDR